MLDRAARPGYTQLDRRHMQPDPAGALIDASRFDYEDNYDYEEVHCNEWKTILILGLSNFQKTIRSLQSQYQQNLRNLREENWRNVWM